MGLLETYQNHKKDLEKRIEELYRKLPNAGVDSIGSYINRIDDLELLLKDADIKIAGRVKTEIPEMMELAVGSPKIIKIFLASSAELKSDRDQFEIFVNRENNNLIKKGLFIRLIIWEDFIDAISETRLQDEYNRTILDCDVFVSLFYTKTGKYTEEEFDTALNSFREKGKPYVYTYFKFAEPDHIGPREVTTLDLFKDKLRILGHFPTTYSDVYDLKYQFKMQLEKLLPIIIN